MKKGGGGKVAKQEKQKKQPGPGLKGTALMSGPDIGERGVGGD